MKFDFKRVPKHFKQQNTMTELILKENVLTNNVLLLADEGKIFKGGFLAIIKEYSFQNSWSDKEHIKRFKSLTSLNKYLSKNYSEFNL